MWGGGNRARRSVVRVPSKMLESAAAILDESSGPADADSSSRLAGRRFFFDFFLEVSPAQPPTVSHTPPRVARDAPPAPHRGARGPDRKR
jgi:hypothetical protein